MRASYATFLTMITVSTAVMLLLMYLNTYALNHVYWSETRFYMALLMGASMAVVMLTFMRHMYAETRLNAAIYIGSFLLFVAALALVRSQWTIGDRAYMKAMIPHHSIAVLTSRRAHITDPRVRKLADTIIETQLREISEMKELLADLERPR